MLVTGRLRLSTIVFRLLHRQTGLHAHAIPATSSAAKCCASVHHASCSPASRNNRLRCRRETARRPASLDDFVAFRSREKNTRRPFSGTFKSGVVYVENTKPSSSSDGQYLVYPNFYRELVLGKPLLESVFLPARR